MRKTDRNFCFFVRWCRVSIHAIRTTCVYVIRLNELRVDYNGGAGSHFQYFFRHSRTETKKLINNERR